MDRDTATRRGNARRTEILDGLIDLFLAEGFLGMSLEQLAGRLRCSKTTLYTVASSKEQLVTAVVRAFFRRSTDEVEERLAQEEGATERIGVYLEAIATALTPASPQFYADVNEFLPTREIYLHNTSVAAQRVQQLVTEAAGPEGAIDAEFIGAVAGSVMSSIQSGQLTKNTSMNDATAYRLLAELIVAGVFRSTRSRR